MNNVITYPAGINVPLWMGERGSNDMSCVTADAPPLLAGVDRTSASKPSCRLAADTIEADRLSLDPNRGV